MATQGHVHTAGEVTPPQLDEFVQRAETSLKAKCPPTPPFSGTTCFALKLGTLTWEVCFPPVGHLMSFLLIPLPRYPKTWPRESFPGFFREGGDAWVREAAPDTWGLVGEAGLLLGGTPWGVITVTPPALIGSPLPGFLGHLTLPALTCSFSFLKTFIIGAES